MSDQQQIKNFVKKLEENGISLVKFLNTYCGIYDEILLQNKISHNDIKVIFPDLVRIKYEIAYNQKERIYKGEIIPVIDSFGCVAPYIKPKMVNEIETNNNSNYKIKKEIKKEIKINDETNLLNRYFNEETLSLYELKELSKILKIKKLMKDYRKVNELLKNDKKEKAIYNTKKLKIERRDIYEY